MKKRIKNIWSMYRWHTLALVAGIFLGWLFFHSSGKSVNPENDTAAYQEVHRHEDEAVTIWTCSMHPQIRQDKPGKCPICGMDLVPVSSLESEETTTHPDEIQLTESAAKLADIETIIVRKGSPEKEIFLQGKVQADERRIAELTARFGGRIEKLFVGFTGADVKQGQKLATIYSPDLVTAQRELLEASSYKDSRPSIYNAARSKLRLWDLSDDQIDEIENYGEPKLYFDILSPISGTVTRRQVAPGDYVKEGSPLFEVIDLSHVWIMFDAYESDLPWINRGDRVSYTVQSLPGSKFQGKVAFIDPIIDPSTRITRVRIEQANPSLLFKPGMFVNGKIESSLAGKSTDILVPRSSILWTGKRAVVYIKVPDRESSSFLYREITLGPEAGNFYVVAGGLTEGEEIAANGVFKIDAAAQLEGKPSMMNPEGGRVTMTHDHSAMEGPNSLMDSGHESMNDEHLPGDVDPVFKKQLQEVYNSYKGMKNAFVASDADEVRTEAQDVKSGLQSVDMELLQGDSHMKWMSFLDIMNSEISLIINTRDISAQRLAFAEFNNAFYNTLETFGLDHGTIYYQYCPMANGDKGAYWLSEIEEIRNPYFGDEMLSCGETRETFDFK
jgi:Cu(I)/Ag(I) efflux system membrane fusion protein